jgi:site-specific DNA-methyltransferase (adenine-specific)
MEGVDSCTFISRWEQMATFYRGDTLTTMRSLPAKSVNLIYFDPPFGTTQNTWDEKQDWEALFEECFRVLQDTGMLIIHCSIPFNYELIRAAPKPPSHSWYWLKDSHTNPMISKIQPLRQVEEILIWKNKKSCYYPQKIGTDPQKSTYMTKSDYFGEDRRNKTCTINYGKYRNHFISLKRDIQEYSTRPQELVELMIQSYSKEGDTILDCFCYKGLSYKCSAGRKWIGIDKHFIPPMLTHH